MLSRVCDIVTYRLVRKVVGASEPTSRCLTEQELPSIPECLRTAQFRRPITDLTSLPRYLYLKFGLNQVNVTIIESHNALPIYNSEYAIAVVLAHISVYPNDFGYQGVVFVLLPLY
jgi:hypothetical protein